MKSEKRIVSHGKFQNFQKRYGYIPAGDKSDNHIIKSRMLQGVYRNESFENFYCNYITGEDRSVNFMRNTLLLEDAMQELSQIKSRLRLTDERRLLTNLLSSQPLAFNLFLPMRWDNYKIATTAFQLLFPQLKIDLITDIKLEYVPGDEKNPREITIDNSCFDVYVEYQNTQNERCGMGIEVKYTESFSNTDFSKAGDKRDRYTKAISKYSKQFSEANTELYLTPKFNQLFRNQLLTEEVKDKQNGISNCVLLVLYSSGDTKCTKAINQFEQLLINPSSFIPVTIESLIQAVINSATSNKEMEQLYLDIYNRYCNYALLQEYFEEPCDE